MNRQVFRISQGEWVCAGCGAAMTENPDTEEGGVIMDHSSGCRYAPAAG